MSISEHRRQLRREIVEFWVTLSVLGEPQGRASFLEAAGLDVELSQDINTQGSAKRFCNHLYDRADEYGDLSDGRDAIAAILGAAKEYVGVSKRDYIQELTAKRQRILEELRLATSEDISPNTSTLNITMYEEWLRLLDSNFNLEEIKTLCFRLGEDYEHLPGEGKMARIRELLLYMHRRKRLHELQKIVVAQRPKTVWPNLPSNDSDSPINGRVGGQETHPDNSIAAIYEEPYLPFANREVEIDEIVKYHEGSYYLFEGPAGYGKTRLLMEIKKRLSSDERNWLCVYTPLPKHNSFEEIARQIVRSLSLEARVYSFAKPYSTGHDIGKDIATLRDECQSQGFCLLLDIDKEPFEYLVPPVKEIIDEFVRGIFDGLTDKPESFFVNNEKTFKLVIAGRYLTTYVYPQFTNKKFKVIRLKPFDYKVVREICSNLPFKSETDCDDFAAHLLFYSGGHPGCMSEILDVIKKRQPDKPLDFLRNYRLDMETIAGREASTVRASITSSLRETFDVLSVYPRFDYAIVDKLIESGDINKASDEDAYALAMRLKRSFLVDWADDNRLHYSDSITRHLLAIGLRYNHPGKFQKVCQQAYNNYYARMEEVNELRFQWAVEILTTFLQISTNQIQDAVVRNKLRAQFFDEILLTILNKLVEGRDKRPIQEPFLGAAEKHPDFRFLLNYYLRDKTYTDIQYQKFVETVNQFFS
jgi:hypothetical protein